MSTPAPVRVICWGELRGEKNIPRVLRILVDGQHAGLFQAAEGRWFAAYQAKVMGKPIETEHASADEAVQAILRSGFARQLGARAASPVYWSDKARRRAGLAVTA